MSGAITFTARDLARRVIIPQRVAEDIHVAVIRLDIPRIRHERIGREECADLGIVVAGVVVVRVPSGRGDTALLTRVASICGQGIIVDKTHLLLYLFRSLFIRRHRVGWYIKANPQKKLPSNLIQSS